MTRTRWRFGLNRRLVATIEWLRLFPNEGFFPQTVQIFDMSGREVYLRSSGPRPHVREEIGHLERRACGLGTAVDPRLRLLPRLARDETERYGDAGLDRCQL